MVRHAILWLFMLILPWQGALANCHAKSIVSGLGTAHWQDHQHGVSHHHGDDGRVQYDDSQASLDHAGDNLGCHFTAAPASETTFATLVITERAIFGEPPGIRPDPFLDKPPRPPHASA